MVDGDQLQSVDVARLLHRLHHAEDQVASKGFEEARCNSHHLGRFGRTVQIGTAPETEPTSTHEIADETELGAIPGEEHRAG